MNIVLIGFMGTGKTVVGKKLSERLKYKFVDTDEEIIKKFKMPISEIFEKYGEPKFRDAEKKVVRKFAKKRDYVISTGGGVVLFKENIERLKQHGLLILLKATPQKIYSRIKKIKDRPLLNVPDPIKRIKQLLEYRKPFYQVCDYEINTDNLTIEKIVNKIIRWLKTSQKINGQNYCRILKRKTY